MVDFASLQALYKQQMDLLLAPTGLASEVVFNFGVSKKDLCPNCIYDPNMQKSSGKYKPNGPYIFTLGQICPYCNGLGYVGELVSETGHLAIIWDYKKWINFPRGESPDGKIQTLCDKTYLEQIMNCKDMEVIYPEADVQNPKFELLGEPTPIGLGDQNYLACMWQKVN